MRENVVIFCFWGGPYFHLSCHIQENYIPYILTSTTPPGVANSFQSQGRFLLVFSNFFRSGCDCAPTKKCPKFSSRGVRLCTHEKVPKIFLARGAIMYTRKRKSPEKSQIFCVKNYHNFFYNFLFKTLSRNIYR